MVKNAWTFILPALLAAIAGGLVASRGHLWGCAVAALALVFSAFIAYCSRNPERRVPGDPDVLVAPADGRVIAIEAVEDAWMGKGVEIRILLNVFNVHVQRSPFATPALVEGTRFFAGKFLAAGLPKASLENEQHWFRLSYGARKAMVKQIAGLFGRRIVPWARPADRLAPGQLIGFIQFGSQVDLSVTPDVQILARVGDAVVGGETVLARYKAKGRKR